MRSLVLYKYHVRFPISSYTLHIYIVKTIHFQILNMKSFASVSDSFTNHNTELNQMTCNTNEWL